MGGVNSGRKVGDSGRKPKAVKVVVDGVVRYEKVSEAVRYVNAKYGTNYLPNVLTNLLRRVPKPAKPTARDYFMREFPQLFTKGEKP